MVAPYIKGTAKNLKEGREGGSRYDMGWTIWMDKQFSYTYVDTNTAQLSLPGALLAPMIFLYVCTVMYMYLGRVWIDFGIVHSTSYKFCIFDYILSLRECPCRGTLRYLAITSLWVLPDLFKTLIGLIPQSYSMWQNIDQLSHPIWWLWDLRFCTCMNGT